jgi:hypothetical protein
MSDMSREYRPDGQMGRHFVGIDLITVFTQSLLWIFGTRLDGFITDGIFPFDDLVHDS